MSTTFGQYIKDARIARGLTLRAASKASGISSVDWSKMERDVNHAPSDTYLVRRMQAVLWPEWPKGDPGPDGFHTLVQRSYLTKAPVVTRADIEEHMPLLLRLTRKQAAKLRPLIRESLTRNEAF